MVCSCSEVAQLYTEQPTTFWLGDRNLYSSMGMPLSFKMIKLYQFGKKVNFSLSLLAIFIPKLESDCK